MFRPLIVKCWSGPNSPCAPGLLSLACCAHSSRLQVLNCMQEVEIETDTNFSASVQIAQLALKHRQNKNQRQRIVIFAGSPLAEDKVSRSWMMGACFGSSRGTCEHLRSPGSS